MPVSFYSEKANHVEFDQDYDIFDFSEFGSRQFDSLEAARLQKDAARLEKAHVALAHAVRTEAKRHHLLTHLSATAHNPAYNRRRSKSISIARESAADLYVARLEAIIVGDDGNGLSEFLNKILVKTQILAARHILDKRDSGSGVGYDWPHSYGDFEQYLPHANVRQFGSSDHRRFHCPFHREKTPSFAYSLSSRKWHCYGCGHHGNHWSVIADIFSLPQMQAIDFCRRLYGFQRPPWALAKQTRKFASIWHECN